MKTEYRVIFTATFDDTTNRDKFYDQLKAALTSVKSGVVAKRADMTRDEYPVPEVATVSEKVI